jgi:hypothetical protein
VPILVITITILTVVMKCCHVSSQPNEECRWSVVLKGHQYACVILFTFSYASFHEKLTNAQQNYAEVPYTKF